jgi:hypothetical protein
MSQNHLTTIAQFCSANVSYARVLVLAASPASSSVGLTAPHYVLLAENLAKWLDTHPVPSFGKTEEIAAHNFQDVLSGRTGAIFFKDYWRRGSENFASRSGDHIDLWNKNEISSSSMWRRSIAEFFGLVSDLNDSKEVWFWEVK